MTRETLINEMRSLKQKADDALASNDLPGTKLAKLAMYGEIALSLLPMGADHLAAAQS